MTLLEIMLVITIASLMLVGSTRLFQMLSRDYDKQRVGQTIDVLFQGAANYYYINCRSQYYPNSQTLIPGTGLLDPNNSPASPFPISIAALVTGNFIASTSWPPASNVLTDSLSSGTESGYVLQLNLTPVSSLRAPGAIYNNWPATSTPANVVAFNQASATYPGPGAGNQPVAQNYIWTIQVAMKLSSTILPADALAYKVYLGADCLSTAGGAGTVTPCVSATGSGTYLVWSRLPSNASSQAASKLVSATYKLKMFKNLYTNDDMYGASTWTTGAGGWAKTYNNYQCGG